MRELSIFIDESGSDGLSDRHYLLTVVMHDQSEIIADSIAAYEGALRAKGLPDIQIHLSSDRSARACSTSPSFWGSRIGSSW